MASRKGPKNFQKILKKILRGYVAEKGEFENGGREPRGARERAQKNFEKTFLKIFLRGYVAEEGQFENGGREPRGPRQRAQNFF